MEGLEGKVNMDAKKRKAAAAREGREGKGREGRQGPPPRFHRRKEQTMARESADCNT